MSHIGKKRKTNFNHRFLLNNRIVPTNDSFESRAFINKLRVSLIHNLLTIGSIDEDQVTAIVDQYIRSDVIVDMHRIAVVHEESRVQSIVPVTKTIKGKEGTFHRFENGLSANMRNRRGLLKKDHNVFALVAVENYLPPDQTSSHKNHSISAFRHNNILFCFNPWGEYYVTTDKRSSQVLPDNQIWEYLRKLYNCKSVFVYTGHNFQKSNTTTGVCVGVSSEFGSHMFNFLLHQRMMQTQTILFHPFEQLGNLIFSNEYNAFVVSLFERFKGSFANARTCSINTFTTNLFSKLKSNSVSTIVNNNNRRINTDLFNNIVTLMNYDTDFKMSMKRSKWLTNNTNDKINHSRADVRKRLRSKYPQLREINGNTINANIRKYLQSGDIEIKQNKNNMNIEF